MAHPYRLVDLLPAVRQALPGMAGVAAMTGICFPLHPDYAVVGCFYLLLVVLRSEFTGFASSAIVSVTAIACLDYFFVPPILEWNLSRPLDGLALLTFLVTALVITRLAAKVREEARIANARRKDVALLYELAWRLVSVSPAMAVERKYLGIFRSVFDLRAVCLFDGDSAASTCDGDSRQDLAKLTQQAYILGQNHDDADAGLSVRCFLIEGTISGAVGFEGLSEASSTAAPLSALAAAMVQRARSFKSATAAAAAAQVEVLRSAILDAFAHQFKTPLAAILTAAGALRETGPLVPSQEEMVEAIEAQAAGLGDLTTRLLRMARLDREEINPRMQTTDLPVLVRRITKQFAGHANGHRVVLEIPEEPVRALADPEMLSLAIVQLLDNAFRYSPPATTITVVVTSDANWAVIQVANEGTSISPEERDRIFERFYRGKVGHQSSGTGLGLYVARKLVSAHGGTLDLDSENIDGQNTTFCLRLPLVKHEVSHERKAS